MRLIDADALIADIQKMQFETNVPVMIGIWTHMKENILGKINDQPTIAVNEDDAHER